MMILNGIYDNIGVKDIRKKGNLYMNTKLTYKHTIVACFTGYVVQAIVNNFAPLLFLRFHLDYHIPLSQVTTLVTVNFFVQLLVDLASVGFVDKIGYRASMVIAHFTAALGIVGLAVFPEIMPDEFMGILTAVIIYAIGGGLLEVLVSPVMEACPTDNKEKAMSLLHSFYCWGHMAVVIISTVFFVVAGIDNWKILAFVWAVVPLVNMFLFMKTPIAPLIEEGQQSMTLKELFSQKVFWLLLIMMVCAGASEQAVSQWASTFAEMTLGVKKTVGDLAGPMSFALFMGISRAFYGKFGDKIKLDNFMMWCSGLCIVSYLMISIINIPAVNLIGCGICGLSVGIMWPGTFSKASQLLRRGGTAMFALFALGGDLGCSGGPTLAGMFASAFNDDLKKGILCAIVFPIGMLVLGNCKAIKKPEAE